MVIKQTFKINNECKKLLLPVVYDYFDKQSKIFEFEDREQLREKLFDIKKKSIQNIEDLKIQTLNNLNKNNIKVFLAEDQSQAKDIIKKLTKDDELIVKSKSNAASEINVKEILSDKKLLETDIGDFIVALAKQEEAHPVLPAISITPQKISELIAEKFNVEIPAIPSKIVEFIRTILKEKIIKSDCAITGANVITATGQIVILENEGNISLISRIPKKHIIISGFEKIVSNLDQAMHVVKCAAIWGTGQCFPAYVNIISSPSKTADIQNQVVLGAQGAKEVYLILIDNGRQELIDNGYEELLYCINCGACLNYCPAYLQFGNDQEKNYKGIRSLIINSQKMELKERSHLANLCTLCHSCSYNCPAKIDLPKFMKSFRSKLIDNDLQTDSNSKMIENIRKFGNPFGDLKQGHTPTDLYCC